MGDRSDKESGVGSVKHVMKGVLANTGWARNDDRREVPWEPLGLAGSDRGTVDGKLGRLGASRDCLPCQMFVSLDEGGKILPLHKKWRESKYT